MKTKINEKIGLVTNKLVDYMSDRDPYEFNDCYNSKEEAFNEFYSLLGTRKGINNILYEISEDLSLAEEYLKKDTDEETKIMINRAYQLHKDIYELKKEISVQGIIR